MTPIEFIKKTNTVLIFVLLVGALVAGGFLIARLRKPITAVHVSVDSLHLGKK